MKLPAEPPQPWRHKLRHSLRWRLVALFVVLALSMTGAFLFGMQKALSAGWRDAARPLVADYLARLVQEIGSPPSVERARALTERLPLTVRISGPRVNWHSLPNNEDSDERWRRRDEWLYDDRQDGGALLSRTTADGHRIDFGLNLRPWRDRPRFIGWATLATLLLLTLGAYAYVRRLLRPLDDIGAGARRFGAGDFSQPIPLRRRDELGDLAADVNAMAESIHQMLEAKRTLLLAISHELRSPITRARLNTELLPEEGDAGARRAALLRDLHEMAGLVTDLLESERLGQTPGTPGRSHAALQLEPTDPAELAREVVAGFESGHPGAGVRLALGTGLPTLALDRTRMRLLLRNLLDNAVRHSVGAPQPPVLGVVAAATGRAAGVVITVRDHGPGVDDALLPHLAEPFYRADSSRERATGGVGLGLYLCKLITQAHGGRFSLRNVSDDGQTGLEVRVWLPA